MTGDKKAGDKNGDEKKEKKGRGPKGKTKAIGNDKLFIITPPLTIVMIY